MVISTHFLAGAAIGRATGNPVLAVVFGFIFHFIMDLVPHWNYEYRHLKKIKTLLLVLADPFVAFAVFLAIGLMRGFDTSIWVNAFLGGFFCVLPDLIEFVIRVLKIKSLTFLLYMHRWTHWFYEYPETIWASEKATNVSKKGIALGLIYQIPFIIVSIYFLVR